MKNEQQVELSFSSAQSAKLAAGLLKHQLESVGNTKVKAAAKGSTLALSISSPSAVGAKASAFSAKRLGNILQGLE